MSHIIVILINNYHENILGIELLKKMKIILKQS